MAKIDNDGVEQIQNIKNALDSMYDKLEAEGVFDTVQEEFQFISEIVDDVQNTWGRA
ncbi:MAG: hypothetical protein H8D94_01765 [Candidatus Pelagibacter sp.]|nr:hypothetical protein [Candidatus Pelagibacter sp.]